MRQIIYLTFYIFLLLSAGNISANNNQTVRVPLIANKEVTVWKTVIYPSREQMLKMHRHEHNRVLVALDNGKLKIKDNTGHVHYMKLEKDKAYYLTKDIPGKLHTDENVSGHPIKVIVIELNK